MTSIPVFRKRFVKNYLPLFTKRFNYPTLSNKNNPIAPQENQFFHFSIKNQMGTIISKWTSTPIAINGILGAGQWGNAPKMTLKKGSVKYGTLMVKNDHKYLYVALDVTRDQNNDPGTNDYFWFTVDVDTNAAVTPNADALFSSKPGSPNELRRWFFLGPNAWKPINTTTDLINSIVRKGFGASPNSRHPHRTWELRFDLSEVGITFDPAGPPMVVRFGLRLTSDTPGFTYQTPNAIGSDLAHYHEIILSPGPEGAYPAGTAGAVIGGVGLIPATKIGTDGFATTDPGYFLQVKDAAFGGVLNLIGNRTTMQSLWAAGARKYRIEHSYAGGAYKPLLASWKNYRWNGATYILDHFGPDANNQYPLLNPSVDYSIDDLLVQWNSKTALNGLHRFRARFFTANGVTPIAATNQVLRLNVDNNAPHVEISRILHNGVDVPACAIVNLTSATDGLRFVINVNDVEGNLQAYSLRAGYGNNQSVNIASDNYAAHAGPTKKWTGVTDLTVPAGEWTPPASCAYGFHLTAWRKVTNGYSFLGKVTTSRYVTLIKPTTRSRSVGLKVKELSKALPYGVETMEV